MFQIQSVDISKNGETLDDQLKASDILRREEERLAYIRAQQKQ
tara:strand:- start:285 stop:413 length:129 start_codon:yes stop_codon:yes gene_type:complete